MSYSSFQDINQVLEKYPLRFEQQRFLPEVVAQLPDSLAENLNFALETRIVNENEAFFTESLIFPLLQQAWKNHRKLKLWSHRALNYDEVLFGEPDYLVAAWPQGVTRNLFTMPLLAVVEAKRDDFDKGWGQCLAGMVACQKFNADETIPIYGIVSNGLLWEFGKLVGNQFTQHSRSYSIDQASLVLGVLQFIFAECEKQVVTVSTAA
jgi:hypothetical protein